MNLSDVYTFKKVAATLSFSDAARRLGVSRSAVSKQINRLERDLGVVLINRTTRSVNLSEAGRTFDQYTSEIDTKIERAVEIVRSTKQNPQGTVALTIPSSLGAALMPALISKFQQDWPELKLSTHFDDRIVDMIAGNFDLAIRISRKLEDSSLVSRRLYTTHNVLAASPGYLNKYGVPEHLADLKKHRCLGLGDAVNLGTTWRFLESGEIVDVPITFSSSANNNLALILSACLDDGIVYLPEICISSELVRERLQEVLPQFVDPKSYGVYAVYPHRNAAAKVKVLVDFIEAELGIMATIDRWKPLSKHDSSATDEVDQSDLSIVRPNVA